jgi:colanic acid/amylovoran biosynthesis protein
MVERIIVDTGLGKGVEEYGNMGDVSMLQVAVDRLHRLFPNACIEVLTDSAENLARFCPAAKPLENLGRSAWFANGILQGTYTNSMIGDLVDLLVKLKRVVKRICPNLLRGIVRPIVIWRLKKRSQSGGSDAVSTFTGAMQNADLLLICGAGGFFDGCRAWNLDTLDLLEAAIQRNMPVAMLGQGFGPLSDPLVLKRASKVLPKVDFITLRGSPGSRALLQSLGVDGSKIETTGDEALELAYESRSEEPGYGLGLNLRFAASASTDDDDIESIRPVLQDFARRNAVSFIPLPIAIQLYTRDDLAIKRLLIGFDDESDGGKNLDSPLKVIKQAALCRVVVTGAYHAAVFALAQGIPVIGLAKSAYFASKFEGLENQFGEGCRTIQINEPDLSHRLLSAIERAWQNADQLREPLLAKASKQIELSRRSYERIKKVAAARVKATS